MHQVGPFLWLHRNLILGTVASLLWAGSAIALFQEDVRKAWTSYRNRWMADDTD